MATTQSLLKTLIEAQCILPFNNNCKPTYCNFPHRCGRPQNTVSSVTMASNVAAVDLMK
jgi:hypothetical protein